MDFSLTTLGTASARPTTGRYPSAHSLTVGGRLFLIDCGEGAQMLLAKYRLPFSRIDNIFISHLHGDHVFGLYGLLSTMDMVGRASALHIYAPGDIESMVDTFYREFGKVRYEIVIHKVKCSEPLLLESFKNLEVYAFPLRHRVETYGYLFKEKERVIKPNIENYIPFKPRVFAYCTDTAPFSQLAGWIKGADLIYHEATYASDLKALSRTTAHSTSEDAARVAVEAGAQKLVLGHFSSRYKNLDLLLQEAKNIFPETYLAEEGMKFDVPKIRVNQIK